MYVSFGNGQINFYERIFRLARKFTDILKTCINIDYINIFLCDLIYVSICIEFELVTFEKLSLRLR